MYNIEPAHYWDEEPNYTESTKCLDAEEKLDLVKECLSDLIEAAYSIGSDIDYFETCLEHVANVVGMNVPRSDLLLSKKTKASLNILPKWIKANNSYLQSLAQ